MSTVQYRDIPVIIVRRFSNLLLSLATGRDSEEVFVVQIPELTPGVGMEPVFGPDPVPEATVRVHNVRFVVRILVEDGWHRRIVEPCTDKERGLLAGLAQAMEQEDRDWAPIVEEFRRWGSDKT